eukprot:g8971.t1
MPVCSDLTSQQRTASGVQIPANGKVIVDARKKKSNCRYQGFSSWDSISSVRQMYPGLGLRSLTCWMCSFILN